MEMYVSPFPATVWSRVLCVICDRVVDELPDIHF
jgi:hypothetical protein